MVKVLTVIGARPQFIKAATVSRVIRSQEFTGIREVIVHTGQHYSEKMSKIFFDELDLPSPDYNLGISDLSHGAMTGRMLEEIEKVVYFEKPDWLLVYGDTNSTLAGALAGAKLNVMVAHVEAGLRSFNMRMPEEVNRIVVDRISTRNFCPTESAVKNLTQEGFLDGVSNVGDVMYDAVLHYGEKAEKSQQILKYHRLESKGFVLATCHRQENADNPLRMVGILNALNLIANDLPVVFPMHPRTRMRIAEMGLDGLLDRLRVIDPVSYLDMISLEKASKLILTDSGGVQKEAFFFGVPCVTMRDETEWVETVSSGWNHLAGANAERIISAYELIQGFDCAVASINLYGDGSAAQKIVKGLIQ